MESPNASKKGLFNRLKSISESVGWGVLIFYIVTSILAGVTALILTWWFVQAKNAYERIVPDVTAYQYSPTNLTIIIPEGIILEPPQGPTITYLMNFAPVSEEAIKVHWCPCNSASAYVKDGIIVYCSATQVTGSSGANTQYYSCPKPVYNDPFKEFYRPWVIGYSFLWAYGGMPLLILFFLGALASSKSSRRR